MLKNCDTIYVVDPDESVHDALSTLMQVTDVHVRGYLTPEAFQNAHLGCDSRNCCILIEADLPGIGSLALIRSIHAQNPFIPIVVLASTSDSDIAAEALKAGAIDVIDKPFFSVRLLDRILGVAASARYATTTQ